MSSDEEKQDKKEPVDIDQMEVGIFIIAKNPDQLQSAAQFLTRRGWPTTCIGNISKAIGTIISESPEIVFISIDHPNPNVARLPIILSQTLNTLCIGFTEDGGAISVNKLNKSKFRYKFNGFPSGPSMHRFIRQTLDSIYNPQETQSTKKSQIGKGDDRDDTIQVKGESGSETITISGDEDTKLNRRNSKSDKTSKRSRLKDLQQPGDKKHQQMSAAEMMQKWNQGEDLNPIKHQNDNQKYNENTSTKSEDNLRKNANIEDRVKSNESTTSSKSTPNLQAEGYYKDSLKNSGDLSEQERLEKKKRIAAKKKVFPWQKNTEPSAPAIKNQQNRPGANFEKKQSRDQLQPNSEGNMEAKPPPPDTAGDAVQQGVKNNQGMYVAEAEEKKDRETNTSNSEKKKKLDSIQQEGVLKKSKPNSLSDNDIDEKSKLAEEASSNQLTNKMSGESFDDSNDTIDAMPENILSKDSKRKKNVSREVVAHNKELTEEEDKFKWSISKALKETCEEPDPSEEIVRIQSSEQLGVIPVDSQKIHGYFIVGRGVAELTLDMAFLDALSVAFEKQLEIQGMDIHCQKPFLIRTERFDFQQWSETVENFTLFEQSAREEIAVTFIPTKERLPHLVDSEKHPSMARIDIERLSTEKAVNFTSYIHLEKNSRFYKYLSFGSKILPRQKTKLAKSKDNSILHIEKSEFESFKIYVAELLIQELVEKVNSLSRADDEAA